ncbi:MAG: glycoside hydrolase family 25 protein [Pararhizobium sp.]
MGRLGAAVAPLLLFLCSCTATSYDLIETSAVPAKFADADPQDFGVKAPALYPVHGIDVSKYQGDIDWDKARRHGVSFVFIKATEGGDRVDPRFDEYWHEARAAGVAYAPYHFYYFCTPPREQAVWFIRNVPKSAVQMPPVIDMEWNPNSPTCHIRPEPAFVRRDLKIFSDALEAHYGKKPIIYTTVDFHRQNLAGYFKDHAFWLRSVADHPDKTYGGRDWTFWQYTGTGIVPGVKGQTDINVFSGDRAEWHDWLASAAR